MTRVALICDYSLDYLGGAQSAFLDEAAMLRERGHEVTVVAPRTTKDAAHGPDEFAVKAGWVLPGVDLPVVRNTRALRDRLRSMLQERSIEVVHVHSEFGLTAAAAAVAAELGLPVVHTVHTFFWQGPALGPVEGMASGAVRLFARWLRGAPVAKKKLSPKRLDSALRGITLTAALLARTVISPSAHQGALLQEAGLRRVVVVPNATPSATASPTPLTHIDAPLRVVWVGRLTPEKRILEFVDAVLTATRTLGPRALEVTIVGDGPLFARAKELVAKAAADAAAISGIHFLGRVDRERVRQLMNESHLVALTSLGFDNQPVVVVEAFNEARSVLYVDSALQEGLAVAGILCESPDAAGMAATLVDLARNPQKVVASSERALVAAEQFSPDGHVRALQQIYSAATASPAEAE